MASTAMRAVTTTGSPSRKFARPGTKPDGAELETFCRHHLAPHKVRRLWRFVSHFPQTASGKPQKFMLREQELKG
jgi:fatty-acyl-CoA synthase